MRTGDLGVFLAIGYGSGLYTTLPGSIEMLRTVVSFCRATEVVCVFVKSDDVRGGLPAHYLLFDG